jgi:hypothetical protein
VGDEILTPSKNSCIVSGDNMTYFRKSQNKSSGKKIQVSKQLKPGKIKYHKTIDNKENVKPVNAKSNSCIISPTGLKNFSPNYKRKLNFSNLPKNDTIIVNSDDEVILHDKVTTIVGSKYGNNSTRHTSHNVNTTHEDRPKKMKSLREHKSSCKTIIHLENQKKVKKISTLTDMSKFQSSTKKVQYGNYLETIYNLTESDYRSTISSNIIH